MEARRTVAQLFNDFINFVRQHTGSEWQRATASRTISSTVQLLLVITLVLITARLTTNGTQASTLLPYFSLATLVSLLLYVLDQKKVVPFGGIVLVLFYLIFGTTLLSCIAIGPAPMVAFSLSVILAGLLYGFWCSLIPAALSTSALLGFKVGELQGIFHPDYPVLKATDSFEAIIVLIIWLHVLSIIGGVAHSLRARSQSQKREESSVLRTHDLTVYTSKREVTRGGAIILLRSKEYEILEYLVRHKGRPVTRVMISNDLWGEQVDSNSIDVHIKHLRDKLDRPFQTHLIKTVRRVGYIVKDLPITQLSSEHTRQ